MNITQYGDSLQIVDISHSDAECLIEILRYYTHRWHGFDNNVATVMLAGNLTDQLRELTNA